MPDRLINLYSDTQTRPTKGMRSAIAGAEVGDEQSGDDPTTIELEARVAQLLGKEAAVFLPSGTMCNEIAILVHCRPGDEIIADETSHILNFEGGGPAALAGAVIKPLSGQRGVFQAEQVDAAVRGIRKAGAIRDPGRYSPNTALVSVEQTANLGGGAVWPLETLQSIAGVAAHHNLAMHMDGARLLNAVVASGVSADRYGQTADTVWIDLSKGLGCPAGAVLAGSVEFIAESWRWKQRIGGALRQSGILAAAGVHALDHHVERLADDHENARLFAQEISELPGVDVALDEVETNMVFFDVAPPLTASEFSGALADAGVRIGAIYGQKLRAVTHLDVTKDDVLEAVQIIRSIMSG